MEERPTRLHGDGRHGVEQSDEMGARPGPAEERLHLVAEPSGDRGPDELLEQREDERTLLLRVREHRCPHFGDLEGDAVDDELDVHVVQCHRFGIDDPPQTIGSHVTHQADQTEMQLVFNECLNFVGARMKQFLGCHGDERRSQSRDLNSSGVIGQSARRMASSGDTRPEGPTTASTWLSGTSSRSLSHGSASSSRRRA